MVTEQSLILNNSQTVLTSSEYYSLVQAAKILECTPKHLLHLGAIGRISLLAPVMAGGVYEWPVGIAGLGFDEIDQPICCEFDIQDRVTLLRSDLLNIEAMGWTIPQSFGAAYKAREMIELLQTAMGEALVRNILDRKSGLTVQVSEIKPWSPPAESLELREIGYQETWQAVKRLTTNCRKTTIKNLFILKKEISRLIQIEKLISHQSGSSNEILSIEYAPDISTKEKVPTIRGRHDTLGRSIEVAMQKCEGQLDKLMLWNVLVAMAVANESHLLGMLNQEIKWKDPNGGLHAFSYKQFGDRFRRLLKKNSSRPK